MNKLIIAAGVALTVLALPLKAASTDSQVAARSIALDLAGAFANDGYKLRDGHWAGELATGKPKIIRVNLYSGNEYWFSAGATTGAKKISVSIYDETGAPVDYEAYGQANSAAAGFSPN